MLSIGVTGGLSLAVAAPVAFGSGALAIYGNDFHKMKWRFTSFPRIIFML